MLKPGKTFRLAPMTKVLLASIVDKEARNAFKRAMIDAQLTSEIVVKRDPKKDK